MATGSVKWFSNAKGYGFVVDDDRNVDVFAHYSEIEMEGFKTLRRGQRVQFHRVEGPKGLLAASIRPLAEEAAGEG